MIPSRQAETVAIKAAATASVREKEAVAVDNECTEAAAAMAQKAGVPPVLTVENSGKHHQAASSAGAAVSMDGELGIEGMEGKREGRWTSLNEGEEPE